MYITDIDTGNPVEVPDTTTDYDSYMYSLPSTCDECLQHWTSSNPLILFASAPNNTFLFKKSSGIDPRHTFRFQVTTGSLAGESERSEAVEGRFQNGNYFANACVWCSMSAQYSVEDALYTPTYVGFAEDCPDFSYIHFL